MDRPQRNLKRRERVVSYTPADFDRICRFIHDTAGIRMTDANERMVYSRLAGRIQDLGLDSFSEYIDLATSSRSLDERERLISSLTTNTTHFYRESYHFDYLAETVLPRLAERARAGERVRLWSAGCSTGEEAYSLAACVSHGFPDVDRYDVKILATDIDLAVLARAETASYPLVCFREMPEELTKQYFGPVAGTDHRTPTPAIRSLITFRHLNLIGHWPFSGRFDVIFCRNVAIYMDALTQEHIWTGFHQALKPDGHLFIGHSERLSPSLRQSFSMVGNTIHRRIADRSTLS
jgi:chemotaxis protein methyltransferase CheR